ncbi:MAG: hypothetical protein CMH46_06005 [Muricauda sp.]|nr:MULTISPECIES: hypothetical protein [unclassified Allomuricauda]MAU15078.1 hypothetical protein [Allomuricauda sp.]|tara:strand:- start:8944 stop:9312 length:369 start_codon:yes stop_codon:yes gene_type:complete
MMGKLYDWGWPGKEVACGKRSRNLKIVFNDNSLFKDNCIVFDQGFYRIIYDSRGKAIRSNIVTYFTMVKITFIVSMGQRMQTNKLCCQKNGKKQEGNAAYVTTLFHSVQIYQKDMLIKVKNQ